MVGFLGVRCFRISFLLGLGRFGTVDWDVCLGFGDFVIYRCLAFEASPLKALLRPTDARDVAFLPKEKQLNGKCFRLSQAERSSLSFALANFLLESSRFF